MICLPHNMQLLFRYIFSLWRILIFSRGLRILFKKIFVCMVFDVGVSSSGRCGWLWYLTEKGVMIPFFVQGKDERSYPKKESHTEENRKRVRKCNNFDLYWNRKFINHFSATWRQEDTLITLYMHKIHNMKKIRYMCTYVAYFYSFILNLPYPSIL